MRPALILTKHSSTLILKSRPGVRRRAQPGAARDGAAPGAAASGGPDVLDHVLATMACHSVVRAGDRLAPGEADTLLRSLDGIDLSLPAPHGRAVLLRLPLAEIGRRFGR
jgi:DNA mismatch repair protein MutL